MNRQHFPKSLRLTGKKDIDRIFAEGSNVRVGDVMLRYFSWHREGSDAELKVLVVSPKRFVKNATDRNRVKRLIREVFRLNMEPLEDFMKTSNKSLHFAVICSKVEVGDFDRFQSAYISALSKMLHSINNS